MNMLTIFLLGASLSMDAFAVSVCGGITLPATRRTSNGVRFGLWFGFFQFLMPVIGYYAATSFYKYIQAYDHWVAFLLLAYIGFNMIREANSCVECAKAYTTRDMLMLAVATSIDALAVGISLMFLPGIIEPALLIGCTTFAFSFVGCVFGNIIGSWGKEKAEIVGGVVLIILGIKVLVEHLGIF